MAGDGTVILKGAGYLLRPLRHEDASSLSQFTNDENYWRYLSDGPRGPAQTKDFVAGLVAASRDLNSGEVWLAVVDPKSHYASLSLVGTANIKSIGNPEDRNGSVGCTLSPDAQGRGLGASLGWDLIGLAFKAFNLHRVECTCALDNEASVHIMRDKYGLTYEGIRRDHRLTPRGWWSSHVFSILEDEYGQRE